VNILRRSYLLTGVLLFLNNLNAQAGVGEDTVREIESYYDSTVEYCNTPYRPAYLCSGLMIRGTSTSGKFLPWQPSPGTLARGGVPFSYLRSDTKFGLAWGIKGLILAPTDYKKFGMSDLPEVLCSFPLDANTAMRTDKGCGDNVDTPVEEKSCESFGITTAEQWVSHFGDVNKAETRQCGFRQVGAQTYQSASHFYASVKAKSLIRDGFFNRHNEVLLGTWSDAENLPILAFYYVDGPNQKSGLAAAKTDQWNWVVNAGHTFTPIVKVTLPDDPQKEARFTFDPQDQATCSQYFSNVHWVFKDNGWSLAVTPSSCATNLTNQEYKSAAIELLRQYRDSVRFNQQPYGESLAAQIKCLSPYFKTPREFFLEPWRTTKGMTDEQIAAVGCNP